MSRRRAQYDIGKVLFGAISEMLDLWEGAGITELTLDEIEVLASQFVASKRGEISCRLH
jgi:hypothetical protein